MESNRDLEIELFVRGLLVMVLYVAAGSMALWDHRAWAILLLGAGFSTSLHTLISVWRDRRSV